MTGTGTSDYGKRTQGEAEESGGKLPEYELDYIG